MNVPRHCHRAGKITLMIVLCSAFFSLGWADKNGTKPAPRQVAMAVSSKEPESPNRPMEMAFAVLEQVQATDLGQHVQVRVVANSALSCVPSRLADPDRLVLDCAGVHVKVRSAPNRVDLGPVRSIRVGQFKPDVARVVVDLEGQPSYNIHPDGNSIVVTFDPIHPKPSGFKSPSTQTYTVPQPVNEQDEHVASRPVSISPDASPILRPVEVTSPRSTIAEASIQNQPILTPVPAWPAPSVSSDPATARETEADRRAAVEKFDLTPADDEYIIGVQDLLAINVWREPELSRSVPVRPDGKISLPLVGDIRVSGLTPRSLQTRLTEELDSFIRKPQVTVIVQEVNSRKFSIIGLVERPGTFSVATHMTILDTLAASGGFRDFAKVQQIYLLRLMPDGSRKRISFDYKAAVNGNNTYRDIEIQPNDTLVVP